MFNYEMPKRDFRRSLLIGALVLLVIYVAVAEVILRFRHPELTETQLVLRVWDALMFR